MSAGEKPRPTLDDIVDALEAAKGREVIARMNDPHADDLPIRNFKTAAIAAWVPAQLAEGLLPVVRRGLVVGYYRDHETYSVRPGHFIDNVARALIRCDLGDRWVCHFDDEGNHISDVCVY